MENSNNRILTEITAWNDKVKNLKEVFGNHVTDNRHLIQAKLNRFKEIKTQYKIPVNPDEKIASKILQAEIRRLEKIAFPNKIERFFRRTFENARVIFKKVFRNGRSEQQVEMNIEIGNRQNSVDLSSGKKNLNKPGIQYTRKLKAVTDDTLLPKLRSGSAKGLKM